MTKVRPPNTFPDAVTRIAGRIGWTAAAEAVDLGERQVRNWSDPDHPASPTLLQALALDAAFLSAGGGEPPMLAVYQARLERSVAAPSDSADIARATGIVAKEAGEAVAALVAAAQPGAPARDRAAADREVQDAIEALTEARTKLGASNVTPITRGAA